MAVEVGARGVVTESLIKAAASIGMRGRAQKRLTRDVGMVVWKHAIAPKVQMVVLVVIWVVFELFVNSYESFFASDQDTDHK